MCICVCKYSQTCIHFSIGFTQYVSVPCSSELLRYEFSDITWSPFLPPDCISKKRKKSPTSNSLQLRKPLGEKKLFVFNSPWSCGILSEPSNRMSGSLCKTEFVSTHLSLQIWLQTGQEEWALANTRWLPFFYSIACSMFAWKDVAM